MDCRRGRGRGRRWRRFGGKRCKSFFRLMSCTCWSSVIACFCSLRDIQFNCIPELAERRKECSHHRTGLSANKADIVQESKPALRPAVEDAAYAVAPWIAVQVMQQVTWLALEPMMLVGEGFQRIAVKFRSAHLE